MTIMHLINTRYLSTDLKLLPVVNVSSSTVKWSIVHQIYIVSNGARVCGVNRSLQRVRINDDGTKELIVLGPTAGQVEEEDNQRNE